MSRLSPLVALLLALPVASVAQVAPSDRLGVTAAVGASAPERMVFPTHTDPGVTLGGRLPSSIEVHVGRPHGTSTRILGAPAPARRIEEVTRSSGVTLGGTYARRVGAAAARTGASLGYELYRFESLDYDAQGTPRSAYGESVRSEYLHAGLHAEVGVPLAAWRVAATPSLGVAGAVSALTTGDDDASLGPRAMPYVRLPLRLTLPRLAVTLEGTAGLAFERRPAFRDPWLTARSPGSGSGTPVTAMAVRVEF